MSLRDKIGLDVPLGWPDAFVAALDGWGTPSLNHVFADVEGNVGWVPAGVAGKLRFDRLDRQHHHDAWVGAELVEHRDVAAIVFHRSAGGR